MAKRSTALLKNGELYDANGDVIQAVMEARSVLRVQTMELPRLRKGRQVIPTDRWYEITVTMDSINAQFKYDIIDAIESGAPLVVDSLVGEIVDRINNTKQTVRHKNIYFIPEELEVFAMNADSDERSSYSFTGRSTDAIEFIDKFPVPLDETN